jgi:hypothetical protein
MHRFDAACSALLVAVAVFVVSGTAAARRSAWPIGVSEARSPIPERAGRAVIALGSRRIMVFGGGKVGEGVSTPDGHGDGAILDLKTKRWTEAAQAPFKVVGPGGVWTGKRVIVLGGGPRCLAESPGAVRQCRISTTRAGTFDPAADRWHMLDVPARLSRFLGAIPLLWTGHEALFLQAGRLLGITPSGRFRTIALPQLPARGDVCATKDGVAVVGARTPREPGTSQISLQLYDATRDRWTTTLSPPLDTAGLLCTSTSVIPLPKSLSPTGTTARYDVDRDQWASLEVPAFPDPTPCIPATVTSCEMPRWSAQGRFADLWIVGQRPSEGQRYDPATDRWTRIATGPDVQPLGDPGQIAWAGALGATYATASGPGSGQGSGLLVYRPGPS